MLRQFNSQTTSLLDFKWAGILAQQMTQQCFLKTLTEREECKKWVMGQELTP